MAAKGKKLYFAQLGGEQPIPPEFIAAMERAEEIQPMGENVTGPETLSDTIVESKTETNRTNERVRRTVKKKAGNITLNAINENEKGQPVQVARTLYLTSSPPSDVPPSATVKVAVRDLGNGFSIREVATEGTYSGGTVSASLFPGTMNEVRQAITLPDKFKQSGATLTITAATSAGTTATTTALGTGGTGIIDSKAQRVDPFTVRLEDTTLTASVNTTVTEYGFYEGLVAPITTTYIDDSAGASSGGLLVTNVQREVIGGGKAINKVEAVASFPTRYGQTYDAKTGVINKFSETTVAPNTGTGNAATDIIPLDFVRQRNRVWDTAAAVTAYKAVSRSIPGKTVVDLPDVLVSLVGIPHKTLGAGAGSHLVADQGFAYVGGGGGGFSPHAKAQASAACQLDLQYQIRQYRNISVDCVHYYFFMDDATTMAQVLTKLTALAGATVNALPVFKTETHQFTIKSQQVSVSASADTRVSVSVNQNGNSYTTSWDSGSDYAGEVGVAIKTVTTPPTIHGSLSVTGTTSDSQAVSVTVKANTKAITGSVAVSAITNEPSATAATAYAAIAPTSLSATSVAAVPTTGLYLTDLRGEMSEHGLIMFHAVVVNFAQYA
jgi:hypothetical protein